jgi:hypothetical protein
MLLLAAVKAGIGVVIVLDKMTELLGVHITKEDVISRLPRPCAPDA